jgi:2,3-bisphosphoglycerate-dependent phosphoglycerate mutase
VAPLARRLGLPIREDGRLGERVLAAADLPDWLTHLERAFADPDLRLPGGETSREAAARAAAAVAAALASGARTPLIVTHGNLMTLLLQRFDHQYGFAQWQALSNPDVYLVTDRVERIWAPPAGS